MIDSSSPILSTLVILAFLASSTVGCNGEPPKKPDERVTGKVTNQGKPVTEGQVTFLGEDGESATVSLDSTGAFTIEVIAIGKYSVSITPPEMTEAPSEDPGKMSTPKSTIPDKYQSEMTTDLTADVVEGGENDFTFDLKPGG